MVPRLIRRARRRTTTPTAATVPGPAPGRAPPLSGRRERLVLEGQRGSGADEVGRTSMNLFQLIKKI